MLSEEGVTLFDVLSVLQVGLIVTTTQLIRCVGSNEDLRLPDPRRLGGHTHYQGIAIPYLHHLRKKKKPSLTRPQGTTFCQGWTKFPSRDALGDNEQNTGSPNPFSRDHTSHLPPHPFPTSRPRDFMTTEPCCENMTLRGHPGIIILSFLPQFPLPQSERKGVSNVSFNPSHPPLFTRVEIHRPPGHACPSMVSKTKVKTVGCPWGQTGPLTA